MVFNGVVGASVEETGNCGPLVAETSVGSDDRVVFFRSEGTVLDLR